jgi:serine/threonine protein kinase
MAPTDSSLCPPLEQLAELVDSRLSPPVEEELTRHLDTCRRCCEKLDRLAAGGGFVSDVPQRASEPKKRSELLESAIGLLKASPPASSPRKNEATQPFADLLPWLEPSPRGIGCIDGYVLTRFLGRGGMGLVFAGWEVALDRPVAIKFLAPSLAAEAAFRERFMREARAAAAVIHPNVVTILAVSDVQGLPSLVMERVEGISLERLTARTSGDSSLPVSRIAEIGRQVAAGLQAAHTAGLLHQDVKPGNILIAADGTTVKLVDFGLARSLTDDQNGEPAGTPGYVSPEVLAGERPTAASDLYGLGCVLRELLTGEPPAESYAFGRQPSGDRRASGSFTKESHWLAGIVDRLLASDPAERFRTAADVEAALAGCGKSLPPQDAAIGDPQKPRLFGVSPKWKRPWMAFSTDS